MRCYICGRPGNECTALERHSVPNSATNRGESLAQIARRLWGLLPPSARRYGLPAVMIAGSLALAYDVSQGGDGSVILGLLESLSSAPSAPVE